MIDDERCAVLLRAALPMVTAESPSRDLWPAIVARGRVPVWSWLDVGLAMATVAALIVSPGWLWMLAYYL
jgi:hypothetical protein